MWVRWSITVPVSVLVRGATVASGGVVVHGVRDVGECRRRALPAPVLLAATDVVHHCIGRQFRLQHKQSRAKCHG